MAGTVVGSAIGFRIVYANGVHHACYNSFNYVKVKSRLRSPKSPVRLLIYYLHINAWRRDQPTHPTFPRPTGGLQRQLGCSSARTSTSNVTSPRRQCHAQQLQFVIPRRAIAISK